MSPVEQLNFFQKANFLPTQYTAPVTNILPMFEKGVDLNTPEQLQQLGQGFKAYEVLKNQGFSNEVLGLTDEQAKKFEAMSFIIRKQGNAGVVELEVPPTMADVGFEDAPEYVTSPDYSAVARRVQDMDLRKPYSASDWSKKIRESKSFKGGMLDVLQTNLDELPNSAQVTAEIARNAWYFSQTMSEADAVEAAIEMFTVDNSIVELSDGSPITFNMPNTDISPTMNVVQTVNEYNRLLGESFEIAQKVFEAHTLKQGEYAVGLVTNPDNPTVSSIHLWDIRDGNRISLGRISPDMDKVSLVNDQQQLVGLIAQVQMQDPDAFMTLYNPESVIDQELEDELNADLSATVPNIVRGVDIGGINLEEELRGTPVGTFLQENNLLGFLGKQLLELGGAINPISPEQIQSVIDSLSQTPSGTPLSEEEIQKRMEETFKDLQGSNETLEPVDGSQVLANVQEMIGKLNPIKSATAATIIEDEGFSATPYDDMGKQSVGNGLQIESLEPDERALIKDINNVQPEESAAVVALKVDKISNYFDDVVDGFQNLPETAQSAMIQMGFQLGQYNVTKEWTKFMGAVKEAAQYTEGSIEQATALAEAKFNMLYNVAEDGKVTATKWATQTKDRAMKVADELVSNTSEAARAITETGSGIVKAITKSIIPSAEASTITPANVGEQPKGEDVVAMATAPDLVTAALKYYGINENTRAGAEAIENFFNDVVGGKAFKGTPEEVAKANAWCAVFLAQILADAGVDANKLIGGSDKYAATRAKSYLKVGNPVKLDDVKAGDIMVAVHSQEDRDKYFKKKRQKLTSFGHVGIIVEVKDGELYYIGGNTGDKVQVSSYGIGSKDLRIRRLDGVTKPDVDNVPSIREMKWGIAGTAVDKLETAWTSMLDIF
tara:strand:- start:3904 stop:6579 length:2676 start_codon:yes stop_codon:yes gene_type:complete